MIEIIDITNKGKRIFKKFVDFPNELYKSSPYYVPYFFGDEVNLTNPKKNVAFDECEARYYLAYDNGKIVGRVAAILQHAANKKWQHKLVRFSRFDFVDDFEVAKKLLESVEEFAREKGMDAVHGPFGFNDLEREGLLIEGFDQDSTFIVNYNYDYYEKYVLACGYEIENIWNEYLIQVPQTLPDKIQRVAEISEKRYGLRISQTKTLKEFLKKYVDEFFKIYDEAYAVLPGTMPLTEKMRKQMLAQFKLVINHDFVKVVLDKDDNVVGVALCFPCIEEALKKSRGRINLPAIFRILKQVKKPKAVEFAIIGVRPGYESKGVAAVIMKEIYSSLVKIGMTEVESNPELQQNVKIQSLWSVFEKKQHKKRATYLKKIK